jgi:hypothetical protein
MPAIAFDDLVREQMLALHATRSDQNFRGPSGDHLLLRMLGERAWLLGPDADRFSLHLALAMARATRSAVARYWLVVHQVEVVVEASSVAPDGGVEELEFELTEEVTSTYRGETAPVRQQADVAIISVARAIVHGLDIDPQVGWASNWNWGYHPGEEQLGVYRLPRRLPPWPR